MPNQPLSLQQEIVLSAADVEVLANHVRTVGRPLSISELALQAVTGIQVVPVQLRRYAPGAHFEQGEMIRYQQKWGRIVSVQQGHNSVQGAFSILTVELVNGGSLHLAAEVQGAPVEPGESDSNDGVFDADHFLGQRGPTVRDAVRAALEEDGQFVVFVDLQGDRWCVADLLPPIQASELNTAVELFLKESGGDLLPRPTEHLATLLWPDLQNDGSPVYELHEFALCVGLSNHPQVRWAGTGWIPARALAQIQVPVTIVASPHHATMIDLPAGLPETGGKSPVTEDQQDEPSEPASVVTVRQPISSDEGDLQSWHENRLANAVFTLRPSHYYGGILPLFEKLRRLLPPAPDGIQSITIHHNFADHAESIPALVDWENECIRVAAQVLFQAFSDHGIYPGAKLVFSHRGNLTDYDLRIRRMNEERWITVRRMELVNGKLAHFEDVEPVRYEIDGDVFVASARFEDLPALFQQAEEAGNSIFGLMYKWCVDRWEAQDRKPLTVTAQQLFDAIHTADGRLTSKGTIAFELSRRRAFYSLGDGRFRFDPENEEKTVDLMPRSSRIPMEQAGPRPTVTPDDPFLSQIVALIDKPLLTLQQNNPFQIAEMDERNVTIHVDSGDILCLIPVAHLTHSWQLLLKTGKLSLRAIRNQVSPAHPAYLAGILAALPGVRHQTDPIVLVYDGAWKDTEWPPATENLSPKQEGYELALLATFEEVGASGAALDTIYPNLLHRVGQAVPAPNPSQKQSFMPWEGEAYQALERLAKLDQIDVLAGGVWAVNESGRQRLLAAGQMPAPVPVPEGVESADAPVTEGRRDGQPVATDLVSAGPLFSTTEEAGRPRGSPEAVSPKSQGQELASPQLTDDHSMGDHRRPHGSDRPPLPSIRGSQTASQPRSKEPVIVNKSLFSRHFLTQRLADLPEWSEDSSSALARLGALWQRAQEFGPGWNEAQTEEELIKPILSEVLGWAYTVQPKKSRGAQLQRPDYTLFVSPQVKDEAERNKANEDAFYTRAAVIAEAKRWERPLSLGSDDQSDDWKKSNPSHQMVSYLVGSRVAWGILTNGRVWRLYSREVSSTASEYYEIDLADIFAAPLPAEAEEAFKRWWLFFRKDAFVSGGGGQSFVQRVHTASTTYAREISDKLKQIVYEEVMPAIAGGFVAYRRHEQGMQQETPESLDQIYRASLSLLYKLLFLLYAEARNLLPMGNDGYLDNSLTRMAERFAGWRDRQRPISTATHATAEYDRLRALFNRVDRGDPSLGVPRYNGGLFSATSVDNQFLEAHKLSDNAVAEAVDLLVRDRGESVDYAYISVRNLGSIYEGLLENKLQVMDAAQGKVALINDKGERKASGSYYTPDYIVEYIVQQTLDPIMDERAKAFEAALDRCIDLRKRLQSREAENSATNRALRGQLEQAERTAREAFLGIKVCDPAMGSGHFLVNAVDHLTDGIIDRMQQVHDARPDVPLAWNPIYALMGRVRREISDEMAEQGIAVPPDQLDDTALLTRLVMKRCIYGVDLNPMAVELAKLSLWLHSFTVGAPLSFLDHHLRWGNSLIGADVKTVEEEIRRTGQQFSLFAGPFTGLLDLTKTMLEIAEGTDATLADVGESARRFEMFQEQLTPYKQALDLWVSQYFGNAQALEFITLYSDDLLPAIRGERSLSPIYRAAIKRAKTLWAEKRFFHWDLEFPEVFIDLEKRDWAENPGFDAVIGNPPWLGVRTGEIDVELVGYLKWAFIAASGQFDLAALFLELGTRLVSLQGRSGIVIPKRIATNESYEMLRQRIAIDTPLIAAIDLGVAFEGVNNDALILLNGFSSSTMITIGECDGIEWFLRVIPRSILTTMPYRIIPVNGEPALIQIVDRLSAVPTIAFDEILSVFRGAECGMNHPAINTDSSQAGLKLVNHLDVNRYIVTYSGYRVDPSQISPKKLKSIELYMRVPKLLIRFLASDFIVGKDEVGYTSTNLVYHVHLKNDVETKLDFLCVLFSSKLINLWYRLAFQNEEVKFPHVQMSHLRAIPIRRIDFTTPEPTRTAHAQTAHVLHARFVETGDSAALLAFVDDHLPAQPERSDVVHDLLAFLAERMIDLNKTKQSEMTAFLNWLERHMGGALDDLSGKTKIQGYLGDYQKDDVPLPFDELIDVLVKNKGKLSKDPNSRAFQERLEREYKASLDKLLPIKAQLAATDRLIDQIVYRLYGLTEEEIGIVEGGNCQLENQIGGVEMEPKRIT